MSDRAGHGGRLQACNLGLSPGSEPERRAGVVTEQRATGVELGRAFLDSWGWAYRFRAGNSFEHIL